MKSTKRLFSHRHEEKEELKFLCETCQSLTCRICTLILHKDHRIDEMVHRQAIREALVCAQEVTSKLIKAVDDDIMAEQTVYIVKTSTNAVESRPDSKAVETRFESNAVESRPNSKSVKTRFESNAETVPDSNAVEISPDERYHPLGAVVQDSILVETRSDPNAVEARPDSNAVKARPDSNAVERLETRPDSIADSNAVKTRAKSNAVETRAKSNAMETRAESNADVGTKPDSSTVNTRLYSYSTSSAMSHQERTVLDGLNQFDGALTDQDGNEWLDFPQQGAHRQMKLTNHPLLRYQYLLKFDKAMQKLDDGHSFMKSHLCHSQAQCNVDHHVGVQRPGMDSKKHKCGLVDPQSM
ncbi:hypothetical protein EMCRGX_G016497 [Ephydatia muelleri]